MFTTERFTSLSSETALPAVRATLEASAKSFGFLPAPVAKAAHSPALLRHLLAGFAAFDASTLSEVEREVVAMSVAYEVGCHYCMALHSALLARQPEHAELLRSLREGTPLPAARLESLRGFVRRLVREHGQVSDAAFQAMLEAGFERRQVLDAVLGAGVYVLSTWTNIVTQAELDPPFEAFRWQRM
jgi:AhpD family alkylhydroperoxidase